MASSKALLVSTLLIFSSWSYADELNALDGKNLICIWDEVSVEGYLGVTGYRFIGFEVLEYNLHNFVPRVKVVHSGTFSVDEIGASSVIWDYEQNNGSDHSGKYLNRATLRKHSFYGVGSESNPQSCTIVGSADVFFEKMELLRLEQEKILSQIMSKNRI